MATLPPVRFGVIGLNHPHIDEMTRLLLSAGAELTGFYAAEDDLAADFAAKFDSPFRARAQAELLEDDSIQLIASAAIFSERGPLGIAAMRHGKDFLSDKPGFTSMAVLEEARTVQRETGCIYDIDFGERLRNRAMAKASELVAAGAIGRVVQTIGMGPHRLGLHPRPAWFFDPQHFGGILIDIGSHQADHFLHFTGSTSFEVVGAQTGNVAHPEHPRFEDFGDALVRGDGGSGYFRVDWLTPDGLAAWGDGRVMILGTSGFMDVRKNIDIAGRPGSAHVFLADGNRTEYIDCSNVALPFGQQLLDDVRNRTETAMPQAHAFRAAELVLRCQAAATRVHTATPLAASV